MTEQITAVTQLSDGWDVHGKTGTGFPANADGSDDRTRGWRWFVGWARRDGKTLVFARLIQDDGRDSRKPPSDCGLATRSWPNITAKLRLLRPQKAEIVRATSNRFMWQRTSIPLGALQDEERFEPVS
jgi:hypothetical protein